MTKLALIATLLMGAAPLAAQPRDPDDQQQPSVPYEQQPRESYDQRVDEGGRREAWVPLGAINVRDNATVDIAPEVGRFTRLEVHALRGTAYINSIDVRFGDGDQQHVDVNRRIDHDTPLSVDLSGRRRLQGITVHAAPDRWARIQIVGQR